MNHNDFIANEISKELDRLFGTFDTKYLATAMLIRSAQALRACHSAGVWCVEDVRAVVESATEHVYTPLPKDQVPRVASPGGNTLQ
jgi:hypothetical protein